jgi:hypothetical protein
MPTATTTKRDECFIRLPRALYDQLAEVAEREDRSIAGTIRTIIREALQDRTPFSGQLIERRTRGGVR